LKHERANIDKILKGLNNEIIEYPALENNLNQNDARMNQAFVQEENDIDLKKIATKSYGSVRIDVKGLVSQGPITNDELGHEDTASTKF